MTYDVIIIGGGIGGLTTAIYTARAGLKTLVIESKLTGGQMLSTYEIENYPGYKKISGQELALTITEQAESSGAVISYDGIKRLDLVDDIKRVVTDYDRELEARCVVLALGAEPRRLGVNGEEEYTGRGVSYCATCDGSFFKGKEVAVVGGGNTALEDALYLTRFAKRVRIIHRRDEFRSIGVLAERVKESNIEIMYDAEVTGIYGDKKVGEIAVLDKKSATEARISIDGVFVAIGQTPSTEILKGSAIEMNNGYIVVNKRMETNIEGVYAVGDATDKEVRQLVTAAADGAVAGYHISEYLMRKN